MESNVYLLTECLGGNIISVQDFIFIFSLAAIK